MLSLRLSLIARAQCTTNEIHQCMLSEAWWALLVQLEVDHTVALHLRSRRVGSDEAVYQVTDLFSTLLAGLAGRKAAIHPELHAAHRHDAIVAHIEEAVAVLQVTSGGSLVRSSC